MSRKRPEVSDVIVYHDEKGKPHNGLVTCVWGEYMVNVVFVSSDESRHDDYGRQVIRESSVPMVGEYMTVHGRYARYPHEAPVEYKAPQAV